MAAHTPQSLRIHLKRSKAVQVEYAKSTRSKFTEELYSLRSYSEENFSEPTEEAPIEVAIATSDKPNALVAIKKRYPLREIADQLSDSKIENDLSDEYFLKDSSMKLRTLRSHSNKKFALSSNFSGHNSTENLHIKAKAACNKQLPITADGDEDLPDTIGLALASNDGYIDPLKILVSKGGNNVRSIDTPKPTAIPSPTPSKSPNNLHIHLKRSSTLNAQTTRSESAAKLRRVRSKSVVGTSSEIIANLPEVVVTVSEKSKALLDIKKRYPLREIADQLHLFDIATENIENSRMSLRPSTLANLNMKAKAACYVRQFPITADDDEELPETIGLSLASNDGYIDPLKMWVSNECNNVSIDTPKPTAIPSPAPFELPNNLRMHLKCSNTLNAQTTRSESAAELRRVRSKSVVGTSSEINANLPEVVVTLTEKSKALLDIKKRYPLREIADQLHLFDISTENIEKSRMSLRPSTLPNLHMKAKTACYVRQFPITADDDEELPETKGLSLASNDGYIDPLKMWVSNECNNVSIDTPKPTAIPSPTPFELPNNLRMHLKRSSTLNAQTTRSESAAKLRRVRSKSVVGTSSEINANLPEVVVTISEKSNALLDIKKRYPLREIADQLHLFDISTENIEKSRMSLRPSTLPNLHMKAKTACYVRQFPITADDDEELPETIGLGLTSNDGYIDPLKMWVSNECNNVSIDTPKPTEIPSPTPFKSPNNLRMHLKRSSTLNAQTTRSESAAELRRVRSKSVVGTSSEINANLPEVVVTLTEKSKALLDIKKRYPLREIADQLHLFDISTENIENSRISLRPSTRSISYSTESRSKSVVNFGTTTRSLRSQRASLSSAGEATSSKSTRSNSSTFPINKEKTAVQDGAEEYAEILNFRTDCNIGYNDYIWKEHNYSKKLPAVEEPKMSTSSNKLASAATGAKEQTETKRQGNIERRMSANLKENDDLSSQTVPFSTITERKGDPNKRGNVHNERKVRNGGVLKPVHEKCRHYRIQRLFVSADVNTILADGISCLHIGNKNDTEMANGFSDLRTDHSEGKKKVNDAMKIGNGQSQLTKRLMI